MIRYLCIFALICAYAFPQDVTTSTGILNTTSNAIKQTAPLAAAKRDLREPINKQEIPSSFEGPVKITLVNSREYIGIIALRGPRGLSLQKYDEEESKNNGMPILYQSMTLYKYEHIHDVETLYIEDIYEMLGIAISKKNADKIDDDDIEEDEDTGEEHIEDDDGWIDNDLIDI